jgi:hypothetical protein
MKIDVVIIGAGPIGLTIYQNLNKSITSIVLLPVQPFLFKTTKNSTLKLNVSSNSGTYLGNSVFWGNQHDVNINIAQKKCNYSDLPGFPFPLADLADFEKNLVKLGWPKISSNKDSIIKLNKQMKLVSRDTLFFKDLELCDNQKDFYTLKVDGKIINAKKIIFAAGGLSNVYFAKEVVRKYYKNLTFLLKSIGIGYSNHPKHILGQVKFARYIRFKKYRLSYSELKLFRSFSPNRSPQISLRLWPKLTKINKKFTLEKFANKFGYAKYFDLVGYFEYPQMKSNSVKFIRKQKRQLIFKIILNIDPKLIEHYKNGASKLVNNFLGQYKNSDFTKTPYDNNFILRDSNHHFGGTRMGTSSKNSVVDSFGKMHFTRGIYFAGTSVIPVSRNDHPTFLSALLAIRTVKKIESELLD